MTDTTHQELELLLDNLAEHAESLNDYRAEEEEHGADLPRASEEAKQSRHVVRSLKQAEQCLIRAQEHLLNLLAQR